MSTRVYLASPILQCEDHECINWREEIKRHLPQHEIFDPMERDYRGATGQFFREIVEHDTEAIDQADILLVNHHKPSVGTAMEILYAWERGKHVVVFSQNDLSPWLLYHSHKICGSLEEAVTHLQELRHQQPI